MATTTDIIFSHLNYRLRGKTDADICENFAPGVVILSTMGRFYGHEGVRASAELLSNQIPGGTFTYRQTLVEDRYAFLEWTAETDEKEVCDGADSFFIVDGLITAQTIHYVIHQKSS